MLLFHISSCNISPDLQLLLASRVNAAAQSGSLVCYSNSRWWVAQQEIFQVTIKVYKILYMLRLFIIQLTYLHHNVNFNFLVMCHISLKQHEILLTHLAGKLGIFTQDVCGIMTISIFAQVNITNPTS